MNKAERVREWCRLYKHSPLKYEMNSLLSVLENDGPEMLEAVLKELGLLRSVDLVKDASPKGRRGLAGESPTKAKPTDQSPMQPDLSE